MTRHDAATTHPPQGQRDYRWEDVELLPYKEDGRALFKSITRQMLFSDPAMHGELRYFEVAPGGFSTLERHEHMHAVLILRGRGHCLVGDEVRPIETRDLVTVPPMTWHQFRATAGEPLGFLCMVNASATSRNCRPSRISPAPGRPGDRGVPADRRFSGASFVLCAASRRSAYALALLLQATQRQPLSLMKVSK